MHVYPTNNVFSFIFLGPVRKKCSRILTGKFQGSNKKRKAKTEAPIQKSEKLFHIKEEPMVNCVKAVSIKEEQIQEGDKRIVPKEEPMQTCDGITNKEEPLVFQEDSYSDVSYCHNNKKLNLSIVISVEIMFLFEELARFCVIYE